MLNVISSKWLFYFLFLVQRFKSAKKNLKPAGASRKFEALLERQENFEAYKTLDDMKVFIFSF